MNTGSRIHQDVPPQLNVATFCEAVLQEVTGNLSLIRVFDTLAFSVGVTGPPILPIKLSTFLVVVIRSGGAMSGKTMAIRAAKPSGASLLHRTIPILLDPHLLGANVTMELNLELDEDGTYWFDVLLDEELLTRTPLRVRFERMATAPGG